MSAFDERVWAVARLIPFGRVTTYGHIAMLVAAPRAARQVGRALRLLPPYLAWGNPAAGVATAAERDQTTPVPWHRVVNAQGRLSPRGSPAKVARQAALLRQEGVAVTDDGALATPLERIGWWPEFVDTGDG